MSGADTDAILDSYRSHAVDLGQRFREVDADEFLAPVMAHIPEGPLRILDLGAGSGRDAAWFAARGHCVVAVEPVVELSEQAASLAAGDRIEWITDALPDLASLDGRDGEFDLLWLCAVWHHLDPAMRVRTLERAAALVKPGGRLIVSLRRSADVDGRLTFEAEPEPAIAQACAAGFVLVDQQSASSAQTHNKMAEISWCWLVFDFPGDLA